MEVERWKRLQEVTTLVCPTSLGGAAFTDPDSIVGTTRFNSTTLDIDQFIFMILKLKLQSLAATHDNNYAYRGYLISARLS